MASMLKSGLGLTWLLTAMVAVAVAGCSAAGPAGRDLVSAARQPDAAFALVEIDESSLEVVSGWSSPSFKAVFGDYRGPKVQRVDVGDTVQVNIWETGTGGLYATPAVASLSQGSRISSIPDQVVARDGSINVPYAGRVKVAGLSTQEIEAEIIKRLQGKTADPQAIVTLSRNVSHSATVTGDVTNGARVPLSSTGDRLLDVVAMAGGLEAPVHEAFITVSRDGTSLSVPMQAILANTNENIYVRPGDLITVYRAPQSFTAYGATGRNAVINFDAGGISLEEAMGKAGGLNDDRSDPQGLFVLRYEPAELASHLPDVPPELLTRAVVPVAYRLDMRDPSSLFRARRFAMRDKDILYVSSAPLSEVEKVLRLFQAVTSPVVAGATVYNVTN